MGKHRPGDPADDFDSLAVDLPNDVLGEKEWCVSAWGERSSSLQLAPNASAWQYEAPFGFSDLGSAEPNSCTSRCSEYSVSWGSGVNETTVIGIDADQCRSACASDPSCCVFAWSPGTCRLRSAGCGLREGLGDHPFMCTMSDGSHVTNLNRWRSGTPKCNEWCVPRAKGGAKPCASLLGSPNYSVDYVQGVLRSTLTSTVKAGKYSKKSPCECARPFCQA